MDIRNNIKEESGIALVIALVILLALTVIGIASVTTSTLDIQLSGNERRAAEALNLADAGIERGLHDLLYDYKRDTSWANNSLYRIDLNTGANVVNTLSANFGDFDSAIGPQFGDPFGGPNIGGSIGNAVDPFGGTQTLGDGKYRVLFLRDASEPDEVYVRSYAEHSTGARKILQLHLKMAKIDAWRNAIFAGRGSATASITGNIRVAGPIHVLGTGDTNMYTISGNSEVINGYNGIGTASFSSGTLLGKLDLGSLEVVGSWGGQPVYSLESVFRVKNVQVKITGAGNIGELGTIDTDGDGVKDTASYAGLYFKTKLDSIYANKTIEGAAYYADEVVMPNGYDLGDKIQMPSFEESYIDPDGNEYDTYENYINTKSITIPAAKACNLKTGKEGASKTPTFCLGTVNDAACSAGDFTVACDPAAEGCIKWNPGTGSGATMYISGRVKFDNTNCGNTSYQFGSQGDKITYTGKGLLYGSKTFYMKGSLVTADGSKFIKDNLMGILTKNNLHIAESGDPKAVVMAGLFAAGLISTEAPSQIIGSLVSNLFCLGGTQTSGGVTTCKTSGGGQASDIYYVPKLSDEITKLGMIKGDVIYTFTTYDWEQVY